jgi:hypothetical protein
MARPRDLVSMSDRVAVDGPSHDFPSDGKITFGEFLMTPGFLNP